MDAITRLDFREPRGSAAKASRGAAAGAEGRHRQTGFAILSHPVRDRARKKRLRGHWPRFEGRPKIFEISVSKALSRSEGGLEVTLRESDAHVSGRTRLRRWRLSIRSRPE